MSAHKIFKIVNSNCVLNSQLRFSKTEMFIVNSIFPSLGLSSILLLHFSLIQTVNMSFDMLYTGFGDSLKPTDKLIYETS